MTYAQQTPSCLDFTHWCNMSWESLFNNMQPWKGQTSLHICTVWSVCLCCLQVVSAGSRISNAETLMAPSKQNRHTGWSTCILSLHNSCMLHARSSRSITLQKTCNNKNHSTSKRILWHEQEYVDRQMAGWSLYHTIYWVREKKKPEFM